ncbi:hypothetical protein B194_0513 [Serratia plymuthica A30]|nr:hypothetical protein B194_0513 [Serratia plymuthica A30]
MVRVIHHHQRQRFGSDGGMVIHRRLQGRKTRGIQHHDWHPLLAV